MSDVADKPRQFLVHATCNCSQGRCHAIVVQVPAGEDADEHCSDALDFILGNNFDTGWGEASDDEIEALDDSWEIDR